MSLQNSCERFDNYIHVLSRRMGAKSSANHYFELFKQNNIPVKHLSKEEKQQVYEVWNGCVKGSALATHELVYTATGNFNPYVCSELFFRTNIELALNNFKLKFGFSEKNYFDMLCLKEPMPHTIIRNVNGVDNAKNIPGVVEITFVKHVGDTVTEIGSSTDRIGFVIAEADTPEKAISICEEAIAAVSFVVS